MLMWSVGWVEISLPCQRPCRNPINVQYCEGITQQNGLLVGVDVCFLVSLGFESRYVQNLITHLAALNVTIYTFICKRSLPLQFTYNHLLTLIARQTLCL